MLKRLKRIQVNLTQGAIAAAVAAAKALLAELRQMMEMVLKPQLQRHTCSLPLEEPKGTEFYKYRSCLALHRLGSIPGMTPRCLHRHRPLQQAQVPAQVASTSITESTSTSPATSTSTSTTPATSTSIKYKYFISS